MKRIFVLALLGLAIVSSVSFCSTNHQQKADYMPPIESATGTIQ